MTNIRKNKALYTSFYQMQRCLGQALPHNPNADKFRGLPTHRW